MTGIDVTAAATAKTSTTAAWLPASPVKASSGRSGATNNDRKNGRGVPSPRIQAVGLRFSLPSTWRTDDPETNIRSSSPRWYRNPRTTVEGSSSVFPNSDAAVPGAT
jgi:hypothetical protein